MKFEYFLYFLFYGFHNLGIPSRPGPAALGRAAPAEIRNVILPFTEHYWDLVQGNVPCP